MTPARTLFPLLALALATACHKAPDTPAAAPSTAAPNASASPSDDYGVAEDHARAIGPDPYASPSASAHTAGTPVAAALTRAEWAKAQNRAHCAALVFTDDGSAVGTARRANFAGGWAVAFDTPGQRSAYGIAGVGALQDDDRPYAARRSRLASTWPYAWASNDIGKLPPTSYAGFGREGFGAYTDANPKGVGVKSLAYLIVPGQRCMYNVWTTLGRDHLETLLNGLAVLSGS